MPFYAILLRRGQNMANTSLRERLRAIRKALGVNQKEFSKGIFLSSGFYAQIETETRNINERIYELISRKYNVNKNWLKTGEGDMFESPPPNVNLEQIIAIYEELNPLFKKYVSLQMKQLLDVQKEEENQKSPGTPGASGAEFA
jgi:transcriptional regulator with XRE-family HTH domain